MTTISRQDGMDFFADSFLPKREVVIQYAAVTEQGRLEVVINGETLQYPGVWVRQNCQCAKCFNPTCQSYISSLKDITFGNLELQSATASAMGDVVRCVHNDGHITEFDAYWLYNRRMTENGIKERYANMTICELVSWPNPSEMVVTEISYAEVTETYRGFEIFGDALIRDGIVIVTDAPNGKVFNDFSQKTGLVGTANHYGFDWIVKNEPNPTNHAYTTAELELHTDQPYLYNTPNIQVLHTIKQATRGGENIMSDGVKASLVLKERKPDYYRLLTTSGFIFEDVISHKSHDPQFYITRSSPVINLNEKGEPAVIQWNNACRSSFFNGSPEDYENLMEASLEFYKILHEFAIEISNKPGDMMIFDNKRILHGRKSFQCEEQRLIEGWYFDWDMLYSFLRVAKIKKSKDENMLIDA